MMKNRRDTGKITRNASTMATDATATGNQGRFTNPSKFSVVSHPGPFREDQCKCRRSRKRLLTTRVRVRVRVRMRVRMRVRKQKSTHIQTCTDTQRVLAHKNANSWFSTVQVEDVRCFSGFARWSGPGDVRQACLQ
jgi:hypothetical protein